MVNVDEETTLYRAFTSDGALLYIGIARSWPDRWSGHRRSAEFFHDVARLAIEKHPTREAALEAEAKAIRTEKPQHNVMHNGVNPARAERSSTTSTTTLTTPVPATSGRYFFHSRWRRDLCEYLTLEFELDGSACSDDLYDEGATPDDYVSHFFGRYPEAKTSESWTLVWTVQPLGEFAPLLVMDHSKERSDRFANNYTWPTDANGVRLNWYSLPVAARWPDLHEGLGWMPTALQETCSTRQLFEHWRNRRCA